VNAFDFVGEFEPISQETLGDLEKQYDNLGGGHWFFVEKKDGTKIGYIAHFKSKGCVAIGYMLVPNERSEGYGGEAVQLMVDYLFLTKDIVRIQAETHPDNIASQRVLEKSGFTKEGLIRKSFFSRGTYRDTSM
jgi:ribosomal-protein-alanine N-acetyltransferase